MSAGMPHLHSMRPATGRVPNLMVAAAAALVFCAPAATQAGPGCYDSHGTITGKCRRPRLSIYHHRSPV
eukprot:SAG22_NODE_693_length_7872_cov_13.111797_7_plen_69_part_00